MSAYHCGKRQEMIHCTATGDSIVTRFLPADKEYEGFKEVRNFIMQGDCRLTNLETTVHNFESYAAAQSGGTWLCSPPGVLNDIKKFGINIVSTANNHALDYSFEGLLRTIDYLNAAELAFAGTGENLSAAASPVYMECSECRYAMISCTMTFNPGEMAGEQSRNLPGRPGVNGVRVAKKYRLPQQYLEQLRTISEVLHLNDYDNVIRQEGYLPQLEPGEQPFGKMTFEAAAIPEVVSVLNESDMERILSAIREACFMADYVMIAFHSHEVDGMNKADVDPASIEFAHRCIDAGADAVIGTGVHLLRPMEIYNDRPIFYCLGNFINQLETVLRVPEDMFAKQKLGFDSTLDQLFNVRSDHGRRGLYYDPIMFESIIPYWEAENGKVKKITFMPIEEQFKLPRSRRGFPRPKGDADIVERFAEMSKNFGVSIKIEKGFGIVTL